MKLILNDSHEVVAATERSGPASGFKYPSTRVIVGQYACVACGLRGDLDVLFSTSCQPHYVTENSGWEKIPSTKTLIISETGLIEDA